MELIRRLEDYEVSTRKVHRKSLISAAAIGACVATRLADIGFSGYIAYYFYTSLLDNEFRLGVVVGLLCFSSIVSACISFYRQKYYELKHDPTAAFILGLLQLQIVVEWYDTVVDGKKTDALKWLLNAGAMTSSIPLGFYFSYIGYFTEWTYPLGIAVFLAMVNMGLTIISNEKELYVQRGLGKLPILSPYSFVLILFRCVELPARVFSYTLFAARFQLFVFIVVGIDIVCLVLIRASTVKRMQLKRDRSREALNRSLQALNKNGDLGVDVNLGTGEEEDDQKTRFSTTEAVFHYIAWQLVYLEGIDAVPFFCLRILEISGMTALFLLISGGVDKLGEFQLSGLVTCVVFCVAYCVCTPVWQFYRSHASFLHPTFRQPTSLQLKVMEALTARPLDGDLAGDDAAHETGDEAVVNNASANSNDERKQPYQTERGTGVNREKSGISEVSSAPSDHSSNHEELEKEEEEEEEEEEESSSEEEVQSARGPQIVIHEVAPAPKDLKTTETQYNWMEETSLDPNPSLSGRGPAPARPSAATATPGQFPKSKDNCRSCTTTNPQEGTCAVM